MKRIFALLVFTLILASLTSIGVSAPGDPAAGKVVYDKKCASCHGAGGEGKDAIAKMLKVEMKPLGSKDVQDKSDAELIKVMKEGTGKMRPVSDLNDKNVQDVVSFLRTFSKK